MNYTGIEMNMLIVLAHPEPQSFNAVLKSTAVETLQKGGHEGNRSAKHFIPG
jgi:putative NADPH-quinone reductase